MRIIFLPIFLVIFLLNFQSSAIALTFNQYYELSECVDTYRTFRQYKKNLQKCYNQKNLNIEDDSIKLIEKKDNVKTTLENLFSKDKKIISLFPGSRKSETEVLLPILLNFIKLMNKKNLDYSFVFHSTDENKEFIINKVKNTNSNNIDVISDENIKDQVLSNSIFAVSKSGTISLQISSANIPSIIIYKLSFINFMIFKLLVNVKFANIINIINDKEVIPELLQKECNAKEIYKAVTYFLKNPELIERQLIDCKKTLEGIKSKSSSSTEAALILNNYLIS